MLPSSRVRTAPPAPRTLPSRSTQTSNHAPPILWVGGALVVHATQQERIMPDISLCFQRSCDRRSGCYRYRARPSPDWQSYGTFPEKNCDAFVKILPGDNLLDVEDLDAEWSRIFPSREPHEETETTR